jgi:ABC-type phosphate transport system substrate-binding protein
MRSKTNIINKINLGIKAILLLCILLAPAAWFMWAQSAYAGQASNDGLQYNKDEAKGEVNISCASSICGVVDFAAIEKMFDVRINIFPAGSVEDFLNLISNKAQIALVTAELADFDLSKRNLAPEGFQEIVLGYMHLSFIINNNNPIKELNLEQLKQIYGGMITNWKALGGADEPIKIFSVDDSHSTYHRILYALGLGAYPEGTIIDEKASVADIALKVQRNANGIGGVLYHKQNAYAYSSTVRNLSAPVLVPASIVIRSSAPQLIIDVIELIQAQTKQIYYSN